MAVIKNGRSMGEVVFVDQGETDKLPSAVKEAFSKESGSIPHVALSDGTGTKVYGTSNHAALKGGLSIALRDAKRALNNDLRSGTAPKADTGSSTGSGSDSASSGSSSSSDSGIKVTEKSGAKEVAGAPMEEWTSSKGSKITARLTRVSGHRVTMVSDKGKTLTLNQTDLAAESVTRLQEILSAK